MTLNDLYGLFGVKFCFHAGLAGSDLATSESNCVKTNKDRHILSAAQISGLDWTLVSVEGLCGYSVGFSRKEALKDSGVAR